MIKLHGGQISTISNFYRSLLIKKDIELQQLTDKKSVSDVQFTYFGNRRKFAWLIYCINVK